MPFSGGSNTDPFCIGNKLKYININEWLDVFKKLRIKNTKKKLKT